MTKTTEMYTTNYPNLKAYASNLSINEITGEVSDEILRARILELEEQNLIDDLNDETIWLNQYEMKPMPEYNTQAVLKEMFDELKEEVSKFVKCNSCTTSEPCAVHFRGNRDGYIKSEFESMFLGQFISNH